MTWPFEAEYRATTYRVIVPDAKPIDLHVGVASPALDALLEAYGADVWAFITAWNPRSEPIGRAENDARHAELVRALAAGGWRIFEGAGIPSRSDWEPEASLLVLGIARDQAVALARRLEQNAIVAGLRGGPAELVYV